MRAWSGLHDLRAHGNATELSLWNTKTSSCYPCIIMLRRYYSQIIPLCSFPEAVISCSVGVGPPNKQSSSYCIADLKDRTVSSALTTSLPSVGATLGSQRANPTARHAAGQRA
jgi:hypothetical protein